MFRSFVTPKRAIAAATLAVVLCAPSAASAARPNVVEIMTDDQTVESLRVMPKVKRLLVDQGTVFDRSYVSFPVCCPSRASFLTGQYPHNNAVEGLDPPWGGYVALDTTSYLPVWLRRVGYNTIHLGKFLNGYGTQNIDQTEVPPGWTDWQGSVDPSTYRYYGYTLNENGVLHTYGENEDPDFYQTDFYGRRASNLIEQYAGRRPFFMSVNFVAPHHGGGVAEEEEESSLKLPVVAPRHSGSFAGQMPPADPSYNEADISDKPSHIGRRGNLSPETETDIRRAYQRRLAALLAVDDAVERIVNTLERTGELDNTLIIFTSDNGFFHGEHRVPFGKLLPYEPSIQVPLVMRGPGVPKGRRRGQLVENVDLAPTILKAAKARGDLEIPMDGRSLFPILRDGGLEWGRDLLIAARGGASALLGPSHLPLPLRAVLDRRARAVRPRQRPVPAQQRGVPPEVRAHRARALGPAGAAAVLRGPVLQHEAPARPGGEDEAQAQLRAAGGAHPPARPRRPVREGHAVPGGPAARGTGPVAPAGQAGAGAHGPPGRALPAADPRGPQGRADRDAGPEAARLRGYLSRGSGPPAAFFSFP